jgi:LemA protein
MKNLVVTVGILLLLVGGGFALFYFYGTSVYDGAVERQENVNRTWADIQSEYQRRADLIPNLVSTVQGAAENERAILTEVTNARAGISNATTPTEMDKHAQTLNRSISIIFERYPEIKSTQNFGMLQASLEGTENRVKKSRSDYNEAVQGFNTYIRGFWKSKALGFVSNEGDNFAKREMFEAKAGSEEAPKVDSSKDGSK